MKFFFKYSLLVYFSIAYVVVYYFVDFSILKSNSNIYSFVPQDAHQVIEVNTKAFIKKFTAQFFYNKEYVLPYLINDSSADVNRVGKYEDIGIDMSSNIIFFSESWESEMLWYCVLRVKDADGFTQFASQNNQIVHFEMVNGFAICLLNKTEHINGVSAHLKQISNQNVKSIDSKIDLSKVFDSENEINYYVSSEENEYITDGLASVKFNRSGIVLEGEYTTVGSIESVETITQNINLKSALSLRTTFNLWGDILHYNELMLDYEATNIVTTNKIVPMRIYPELNAVFSGGETSDWSDLVKRIDGQDDFFIDYKGQNIEYLKELSFSLDYKIVNNGFILTNDSTFKGVETKTSLTNKLFELNIYPDLFSERIRFVDDKLSPPSMMSNLKLGVFKNVLNEVASVNRMEQIYCSIKYSDDKTKLFLNGAVEFKEKSGHSIIESGVMLIDILRSLETIINME